MIIYDKFFCNHYKKVFDFKNKLYNHIRNKEYQQFFIKNKSVNKIDLTSLFILEKNVISAIKSLTPYDSNLSSFFISETTFSDANIVIKKREIKDYTSNTHFVITSFFVTKSITSHKYNLLTFTPIETLTSLLIYRFISPSSFTYELYKKSYFTIVNLYIRYALLSILLFIIIYTLLNKSSFNNVTRIIIVFFVIFMQNLYKKFYNKKKRVILTLSKTFNSSIKQYATRQNLEYVVFERFEFIRYSKNDFSLLSKPIAQRLIN